MTQDTQPQTDPTVTVTTIMNTTLEFVGWKARLDTEDRVLVLSRRGHKDQRLMLIGIKTWKQT